MMKLVEEYAGVGDLNAKETVIPQVRYRISRYQGFVDIRASDPGGPSD